MRICVRLILLAFTVGVPSTAIAQYVGAPEEGWRFVVAPYLWLSSMSGSTTLPLGEATIEVPISDIVDNLETAFMGHFEGKSRHWGFMVDVQYVNLGTTRVGEGPLGLAYRFDPKVTIVEGAATYLVRLSDTVALDFLAGLRWWQFDIRVGVLNTPFEVSDDVSWVDPMLGTRLGVELSPRWVLFARGDIGGFGVGSKFAWSADGGIGFHASDLIALVAEYRVLAADYEDFEASIPGLDLNVHGPGLGIAFTF